MNRFDKRLTPARPDLAAAHLAGLVEAARFVEGTPRQVVAPSAPLTARPDGAAPLESEVLFGERLAVYEEAGGFAYAQCLTDGYVGYIPLAALGPPGGAPTHRVAALRAVVNPAPRLKEPPQSFMSLNARLTVVGEEGDYLALDGGGFVHRRHAAPLDAYENDVAAVALRFLGAPYLWGGRTSLGLDCSGLVQAACHACGLAAPRDSDMQAESLGEALPVEPLAGFRRGELLFWKGHVGMMLDETRLLHANAYAMQVAVEPVEAAIERIAAKSYGRVTARRRLPGAGA